MSLTSARIRSCASGWRRSRLTDFLLRDCTCHQTDVPSWIRRQLRRGSPLPGGSILITSAPNSPSILAANGPAISWPNSSTRIPLNDRPRARARWPTIPGRCPPSRWSPPPAHRRGPKSPAPDWPSARPAGSSCRVPSAT
ncbi:hypothetical protein G6F35_017806 [Rhizopus arrhizus]|nr:hypothetical protein G6F35_017806 [Rhizopus arrhizus]